MGIVTTFTENITNSATTAVLTHIGLNSAEGRILGATTVTYTVTKGETEYVEVD